MRPLLASLLSVVLLPACGGGSDDASTDGSTSTVQVDRDLIEVANDEDGETPDDEVIEIRATNLPSGGFFVGVEYTRNGIDTLSMEDHGETADVQIHWQDIDNLPLGTFEDTVTIHVCYDEACTDNADGSPIQVTTRYEVQQLETTAAGHSVRVRSVNLVASNLAWDPVSARLYAAVPGESVIAVIDPQSARVNRRQPIAGVPRRIATSDDGRYLYVSNDTGVVRRLTLPDLAENDTYLLSSEFSVLDLEVAPGTVTLAISAQSDDQDYIAIFGDEGFEARYGADTGSPGDVTWNADGITVYAKSFGPRTDLHQTAVHLPDDDPAALTTIPDVFEQPGGDLSFANGRLVDDFGTVVEAETGARHGTIAWPSDSVARTTADGPLNRVYAVGAGTQPRRLGVFDLGSLDPLDTIEIPKIPDAANEIPLNDVARWGEDGLAIASGGRLLLVSGTVIAP